MEERSASSAKSAGETKQMCQAVLSLGPLISEGIRAVVKQMVFPLITAITQMEQRSASSAKSAGETKQMYQVVLSLKAP